MRTQQYISTRIRWIWISSLASTLIFFVLAAWVLAHQELRFDIFVTGIVRGTENPMLTDIAKAFTFIGSKGPIILIAVIILWYLYAVKKMRLEVKLFVSVLLGSEVLNLILKLLFQRIRPDVNRLIEITGYSFPSGHSMAAFSLYGILTYLLWKKISARFGKAVLAAAGAFMILCIGLSRVYLGVHYPSDVVGGFAASLAWLLFNIGWYKYRKAKIEKSIQDTI
ncbi:phosphatase PAP2 family protein [Paenibacillus lemnae]|uniref:Phosphatase PAP2 family protein n=1 Tax=Paenibacillus lemnae TaxID=1330551 RepID=A0A848M9E6_PAELE|nr:phosphatase PAP2 family protein [Paenibacillus lemnae]NMO96513.1 phosphatase PAP2 family protein [Paenibacillus lemnae]